jgi:hypothetical protein
MVPPLRNSPLMCVMPDSQTVKFRASVMTSQTVELRALISVSAPTECLAML